MGEEFPKPKFDSSGRINDLRCAMCGTPFRGPGKPECGCLENEVNEFDVDQSFPAPSPDPTPIPRVEPPPTPRKPLRPIGDSPPERLNREDTNHPRSNTTEPTAQWGDDLRHRDESVPSDDQPTPKRQDPWGLGIDEEYFLVGCTALLFISLLLVCGSCIDGLTDVSEMILDWKDDYFSQFHNPSSIEPSPFGSQRYRRPMPPSQPTGAPTPKPKPIPPNLQSNPGPNFPIPKRSNVSGVRRLRTRKPTVALPVPTVLPLPTPRPQQSGRRSVPQTQVYSPRAASLVGGLEIPRDVVILLKRDGISKVSLRVAVTRNGKPKLESVDSSPPPHPVIQYRLGQVIRNATWQSARRGDGEPYYSVITVEVSVR